MRLVLLATVLLLFSRNVQAQVFNAGLSGNTSHDLLQRIEKDVLALHPNLTIIMVGTNDMLNTRKMISKEEYAGNLNQIVKRLNAKGSKVLLMSSPPVDSVYLFTRHDKNRYSNAPNEIMGSISRIMGRIALENQVLFLDLNKKFLALNLPKHNADMFFRNEKNSGAKDGVHPTALGYHFIASNVFQFLKEQRLINENLTIVCFGDSITYGAGSKGGGTIDGKNYPSYLAKMINDYLRY